MTSKKGQFAIFGEWWKHLRPTYKRIFWKSERSKSKLHLKKLKEE